MKNGLNQYTTVGGLAQTHDTNGNLKTNGTGWTYTYDLNNRLKTAVKTGTSALTANLNYDAEGRLRQTVVGSATTNLWYDGTDLLTEYNGTTLARRYVHGPGVDEPLVWYEGSGTANKNWIYSNHLGSVVALANTTGTSTATYTYGPYGEPNTTAGNMRFRYTGQTLLAPLGLYYYKARIYSPTLGRFLQTDPIGTADDMNLYAYVGNNPVNGVDPTGLYTKQLIVDVNGFFSDLKTESGMGAMLQNYNDMKDDQTRGNDKYFHCLAHCEASMVGKVGEINSHIVGFGREYTDAVRYDKYFKEWKGSLVDTYNFMSDDRRDDFEANKTGRDNGVISRDLFNREISCKTSCGQYVVPGINKKYLRDRNK